jgi:hypothetical protein
MAVRWSTWQKSYLLHDRDPPFSSALLRFSNSATMEPSCWYSLGRMITLPYYASPFVHTPTTAYSPSYKPLLAPLCCTISYGYASWTSNLLAIPLPPHGHRTPRALLFGSVES